MKKFGTFTATGPSRIILALVNIGFGRGRLKRLFAQTWNRLNSNQPLDLLYHGLMFRLHPQQNTIESKMIFSSKRREETELNIINHYLTDDSVFLDIGANIGYYALNVARLGAQKVIAIEPNPVIAARLNSNIALNNLWSKIAVHEVAVGAKKGVAKLTISDSDLGSSSIVDHSVGERHISVPIIPLLEILQTEGVVMADIVKIDIEGMEDRVLFPYFEAIEPAYYPRLIVMEDGINSQWERDILSWLLVNGYHVATRTRGNVVLVKAA